MTRPPSTIDAAVTLLTGTPGVVSDTILADHGVNAGTIIAVRKRRGLDVVRVRGLGYRLRRNT